NATERAILTGSTSKVSLSLIKKSCTPVGTEIWAALSRPQTIIPASAPHTVAERPSTSASVTNIQSTRERCIPIARRVPTSRVRSRTAIHIVYITQTAMITSRTKVSAPVNTLRAVTVYITNEISSSQLVTSSL